MPGWSSQQQVCCTCRYWCGRRDVNFTCDFFDALDSQGKCCNPNGGFRGLIMYDWNSCSNWESFKGK